MSRKLEITIVATMMVDKSYDYFEIEKIVGDRVRMLGLSHMSWNWKEAIDMEYNETEYSECCKECKDLGSEKCWDCNKENE